MSHIHIPDGVLPVWLWAPGWIVAGLLVFVASRRAERYDVRRKLPLLSVTAALMLVAMSAEILPIAYHINLAVLGGVLLGPELSIVAAFVVVAVLALLGHGGITVIGLNTIMIATEMCLGWALFRALVRVSGRGRVRLAAAGTTVLTLAVTTTMLVGLVALSGTGSAALTEAAPGMAASTVSVARFAAVVYALGSIGWVIEALVTASILGYVSKVRPTLVFAGVLAENAPAIPSHEGSH